MTEQKPAPDTIESLLGEAVPTLSTKASSGQYYLPASHIQLLEQLEHLSRYSHFVQVITGVTGIGKSTLLRQFYPGTNDTSVHACCIQASSDMSAQALLAEIAAQLNLDSSPSSPVASQLQALIEHGELLKQISRQLLIVIDDAERLAVDAIELLLNQLSTLPDDDVRPHLVLFATAAIKHPLSSPNVSEVVASSCHFVEMQPLSAEEINGLLEHSFHAVAARLNEQHKQRILTDSLGLPGRIPRALDAILTGVTTPSSAEEPLSAHRAPATDIDPAQAEPLIPAATALPRGAAPHHDTAARPTTASKALARGLGGACLLVILAAGVWLALPTLLEYRQAETSSPPLASTQPDTANRNVEAGTERIRLQLSINTDTEAEPIPPDTPATGKDSSFEQRLAQARAALDAEQSLNEPEPEKKAPIQSVTEPTALQKLEPAPVKPASTAPTEATPTDPSNKLVLKLPAPASQDAAAEPAATAAPQQSFYGDGQVLLDWEPKGYSLQMLGAREEKNIREFIAAMPDRNNLHYFFTLYKDKPWYVVIYGRYPDRAAAMTARGELPEPLRAKRPWARSIKGIQNDIRKGAK